MKDRPLISVCMPAYNAGPWIRRAIDCMLNQSYDHIELIIADDGSSDDTKSIIDGYEDPRIVVAHNDVNQGYLKTSNKLKKLATGDFITFQDADDYSELNRLEILLDAFREDPEAMMIGSNYANVDVRNEVVSKSDLLLNWEDIKAEIPNTFPTCGATLMLKREVYDDIGGYDEYFDRIGAEDFYWLARIIDRYKVKNISDCLYYYLGNPASVSRNLNDLRKLFVVDSVRFLVKQRRETGTDSLLSGDHAPLEAYLAELRRPYEEDKLLYLKKQVQRHFWNEQYAKGYKLAFKICCRNPFQPRAFYKDLYIYLGPWIKGK